MKLKLLITSLLFLLNVCAQSQEKFQVNFSFPAHMDLSKLLVQVDNGFGRRVEAFEKEGNNQIRISGYYYAKYAAIILQYPRTENWNYRSFFFVKSEPASINFLSVEKDTTPFLQPVLTNALDFKAEREKLEAFTANESAATEAFYKKHGGKIFEDQHNDLRDEFMKLDQNVYKKSVEYITKTRKSYFSFWWFKSNIRHSGLSIDSILTIFDKTFPVKLKASAEGNAFKQLLRAKLDLKRGFAAPLFSSKDIDGNPVILSNFRGKKLVLLNFWATWCVPCIKKMPAITDLQDKFGQDLEIISIAYPTTLTETKQAISRHKMNWTNIYDDEQLINSYGGLGIVPRIFLIDKMGKIIFDNLETPNVDMEDLAQLLKNNLQENP